MTKLNPELAKVAISIRQFCEPIWEDGFRIKKNAPISAGMCVDTSELVYLILNDYYKEKFGHWVITHGKFHADKHRYHYWTICPKSNLILDLTADQFSSRISPVLLCNINSPVYIETKMKNTREDNIDSALKMCHWYKLWKYTNGNIPTKVILNEHYARDYA